MNLFSFSIRDWDRDVGNDPVLVSLFNSRNPLAENLEAAYLNMVSKYKQELRRARGNYQPPVFKVKLPGGTQTVVLDEELDARLMEIYMLHGWEGILKLEQAIITTRNEPLFGVIPFYLFTRNRLILLIRQALIEIEKLAAQDIYNRLDEVAKTVTKGWTGEFNFTEQKTVIKKDKYVVDPHDGFSRASHLESTEEVQYSYLMENRELSDDLYTLLSNAVNEKAFIDEQHRVIEKNTFNEGFSAGTTIPYDVRSEENPFELNIIEAERQIRERTPILESYLNQISTKSPLALLAIPLLKKGFSQPDMENAIAAALLNFKERIEKLAKEINPSISMIETDNPVQLDMSTSENYVVGLYPYLFLPPHDFNLELDCAQKAISEVLDHRAYLPLLSEETMYRLMDTGAIEQGSLAWIVCTRYPLTLMEQLESRRKSEENFKALGEFLAKLGAALSLAAFISRPLPQVSGPLQVASGVLGVPAMLFQMYSVIHQLSLFDEAIYKRMGEADPRNIEAVAKIGEIIAMRSEYAEQITINFVEMIVKEKILSFAGGKWMVFKKALLLRDYYEDLNELLGR